MVTKREELQIAMATIELGFVTTITEHTEHKIPIILVPYVTFEIEGSDLILFSEDEFDAAFGVLPDQERILLYNLPSQACEGPVDVSAFRQADGEKFLAIDKDRVKIWGILGASLDGARRINDRGAWGFFEGDDGKKYRFSYGSETFVHYLLPGVK